MIRDGRIEHEAHYAHPPDRVWQALVDPAELATWLMPNDFAAEVGHRFEFDARPALGVIAGEVLEIDPPKLLRCRWSGVFGATIVRFELTPTGDGTRLTVEHSGWDAEHRGKRDGFDQGWIDKLNTDLPAVLDQTHPTSTARTPPTPTPNQATP
jgi:uncharacterized protein YndB with AHSA1/START domain